MASVLIDGYRRMSIQQKLDCVRHLSRNVQQLALCDLRRRYPESTEQQLRFRLASRWLNGSTMRKAFGWDPEREGR